MSRPFSRLLTIVKERLLQKKQPTPVLKEPSVEAIESKHISLCSLINQIPLDLCNNNFDGNTVYFYSEMLGEMACLLKFAMDSRNSEAPSLISRLIEIPFLFLKDAEEYFKIKEGFIENPWFYPDHPSGFVDITDSEKKMRDYLCAIMDMQRSVSASKVIFYYFRGYEHPTYSFNSNEEKVGLYFSFQRQDIELTDMFREECTKFAKQCIDHNEFLFRERYDQKHQQLHANIKELDKDIKELVGDLGQKGRANMPTENSKGSDVRRKTLLAVNSPIPDSQNKFPLTLLR